MQHEEGIPVPENNLITFTPLPGPGGPQENRGGQPPHEPKGQRTPRRRKTHNGEWDLNQRHFNQNKPQEISYISPVEQVNIYNTEEPSYHTYNSPLGELLMLESVQNVVTQDIGESTVKLQHGVNFVHQKHILHRRAGSIQILLKMIQSHQTEQLLNSQLGCSLNKDKA